MFHDALEKKSIKLYILINKREKERALWFVALLSHYTVMLLHVRPVRSLMHLLGFCIWGSGVCPPSIKARERLKEGKSCVCPRIGLNNIHTVFVSCKRVLQPCQVRTLHINLSQLCVPWIVKTQEREEVWMELTPTVQGISLSSCVCVCEAKPQSKHCEPQPPRGGRKRMTTLLCSAHFS